MWVCKIFTSSQSVRKVPEAVIVDASPLVSSQAGVSVLCICSLARAFTSAAVNMGLCQRQQTAQ